MPQITTCPECTKQLRVPDDLIGRKVRCPGCSAMFTAEAAAAPPPPPPARAPQPAADRREAFKDRGDEPPPRRRDDRDDYDDRRGRRDRDDDRYADDRRPRRRDDDYDDRRRGRDDDYDDRRRDDDYDDRDDAPRGESRALRGVRTGINLNVIASWLFLGVYGMYILFFGIAALIGASASLGGFRGGPNTAGGVVVFICLFAVLILGALLTATVLVLVGMGMCMQTPRYRNSSARGLAIAAFACVAAAAFLYVSGLGINIAMAASRSGAPVGGCVQIFTYPLLLAGVILWLFYLRSLCFQLRNREVAGKVMAVFIGLMVLIGLSFLVGALIAAVAWSAFASLAGFSGSGGQPTAARAAGTVGGVFIFALVMAGLLFLAQVGLQVWYTVVLQRVRDVVDRYRARL